MGKRRVGKLGESTLHQWCAQVDITANKAIDDERGWDYILEFPLSNSRTNIRIPLDKMPFPIKCLIQVKSTDGTKGKWSIKLSNWVHLINNPLPTFFLIFEFDGADSCQRAFLVHVDKIHIEKALKRLRKSSLDKSFKLNEHKLQFKWNEENTMATLNGQGLESAICAYIPDGMEAYTAEKLRIVKEVGYEEGNWRLNFVFPAPPDKVDIQELIVDFSLGLIPHLDVIRGSAYDSRFGILVEEPEKTFEGGRVEIVNREAAGRGLIVLTSLDGRKELRIPTEVYLPQGIGFDLERKYFKVRFVAPFVDFTFQPFCENRADFKYNLPNIDERHSLEELQIVSELILLLFDASIKQGAIRVEARYETDTFFTGQIDVRGTWDAQIVDYATAVVDSWTIAKYFDIHHLVQLMPIELLRQKDRLMFMSSVIGPARPSARLVYWSNKDHSDDGQNVCVPYVTNIILGQYLGAIAVAIIGRPEETGQIDPEKNAFLEFQIETNDVELCHQYLCGKDEIPQYTFKELAQFVIEEYQDSTSILITEGINNYLAEPQDQHSWMT